MRINAKVGNGNTTALNLLMKYVVVMFGPELEARRNELLGVGNIFFD